MNMQRLRTCGFQFTIATIVVLSCTLATFTVSSVFGQQVAVEWWRGYSSEDAIDEQVLGFWNFDGDEDGFTRDLS
ncbi:MAG TPA: hypothetical protein P5307_19205, partial [Pirellulaceae bacterium]|nr:hypothetical protein [Pirellulaceae bacterium]